MVLATAGARRSRHASTNGTHNVARPERVASVALGAAFITMGLRNRSPMGIATAVLGGFFVHRGATGNCPVYNALGVSTGDAEAALDAPNRRQLRSRAATVNAREAIKVERSVTIQRPRAELYAFWRNFENLPRFMEHLESVRITSPTRSHWVAKAPAGTTVEWDAEIVNEIADTLIAWKTIGHPDVANAGAVNFSDSPGDRGTVVRVTLDYEPPGGRLGSLVARLFGEEPDRQVREDLRKFKQLMEVGEITTSARRAADSAYVGSTPRK
jgi:uncharacterized membrane protein